ncbi:VOC family protein [Corynebacterium sp. A21]
MAVSFNHTIIGAHDPAVSAEFYKVVIGAKDAPSWGPFTNLILDDRTLLQFAAAPVNDPIHMAFLMSEAEFRHGLEMLEHLEVTYWADPRMERPGEISDGEGLRVYFKDPSGHFLEMLTQPYL